MNIDIENEENHLDVTINYTLNHAGDLLNELIQINDFVDSYYSTHKQLKTINV